MKTLNYLLISLLLLAPAEYWGKSCGVRGILGESATNHDLQRSTNNYSNVFYQVNSDGETKAGEREPMIVKVRYESGTGENRSPKQPESCERESKWEEKDPMKDSGAKWKSSLLEKTKNSEGVCRSVRVDFPKEKLSCRGEPRKGQTLCADCDQCEVQVKSTGDGVVLKCQQCRNVPSEQIVFPSGNNQKIIRLP